jgi:hypothetical protein
MEICGRRLFQSPSQQFKGQGQSSGMHGINKACARQYQSKLEDILEEDTSNFNIENHHNCNYDDNYYYHNTR